MKRLVSIDIAKAICIILVVIGHYNPDNAPAWYQVINRFIYSFHMPLFMFASGYVYMATKKEESYWTFLKKKVKRLMIPYLSTSVIVITIKLLTQRGMLVEHPVTWLSYLKIFYLPEAGYFLWFIWALWDIFLLLPLIKTKKGRTLLFFISLVIGYIPFSLPDIFCIKQFAVMLKFFMLGVFLYEHRYLIEKLVKVGNTIIFFIWIALFSYDQFFVGGRLANIIDGILPYIGIYSICMLSISIHHHKWGGKLLIVAGSSYIIYLFHTTFEGFMKSVIHKVPLFTGTDNFLTFSMGAILVIACGVFLPIFLHRYILCRSSVLRILFGLKRI